MMKMVAVSALCLLGALYNTATVEAAFSLMNAAVTFPCGDWNCECAFNQTRGCCCAEADFTRVEDTTHLRMVAIWKDLEYFRHQLEEFTGARKVAFSAAYTFRSHCFGPYTSNVPIRYDNVTLNQGNGYNPALGAFTAPQAGTYSFSFTAHSDVGAAGERIYHQVRLMMNGRVMASVWEDNREDSKDSGTQSLVLQLNQGCQVYVELLSGRLLCHGNNKPNLNIFSGYLIYPSA